MKRIKHLSMDCFSKYESIYRKDLQSGRVWRRVTKRSEIIASGVSGGGGVSNRTSHARPCTLARVGLVTLLLCLPGLECRDLN